MTRFAWLFVAAACSGTPKKPIPKITVSEDGAHKDAVAAQVKPYLDGEVVAGLVIGLYDAGKVEVYGFGKGPDGEIPTGETIYELGSATKVFTGLLLADSVQRKELDLDAPVSTLLPPGVTVPTRENTAITMRHLAIHSSGLPRQPPSVDPATPDPYAKYTEDSLYRDLIGTALELTPGKEIIYSNFGYGLLGHVLGRKIGGGFSAALSSRVLKPLDLRSTFMTVPADAAPRRAVPSDDDLKSIAPQTFGEAIAGAGGLSTTAHDELTLLEAELDAASGGKGPLRGAMRFSQEEQIADSPGENAGLGWLIDARGRAIHSGGTTGSRGFIGIDTKTRRAVVVLASTGSSLVDRLGGIMFDVLDGTAKAPGPLATDAQLAIYAGSYDLSGTKLNVVVDKKRMYLEGPGEPRHRMGPITDVAFWIEALQAVAFFHVENGAVKQIVFQIGDRQLVAPRL